MRPSKFTEVQVAQALRQVKGGTPAVQICRKLGITQTTFYRWRSKYGGGAESESRELRELREENQKLKQIVANLLLDKEGPTDFLRKK
ncbi:MAG TPA: transposase [Gemmatimonadaceae bacterium]